MSFSTLPPMCRKPLMYCHRMSAYIVCLTMTRQGIKPVSYTHLVSQNKYWKMDLLKFMNNWTLPLAMLAGVIGYFAVSYTHLDVYKRQIYVIGQIYSYTDWMVNPFLDASLHFYFHQPVYILSLIHIFFFAFEICNTNVAFLKRCKGIHFFNTLYQKEQLFF